MVKNGVFYRRKKLFDFIISGIIDGNVIEELLPKGEPHEFEKQLWDYKENLPVLPKGVKPNQSLLSKYNYKLSEVMKDAVSFYNSYGGYLLIGVADFPRKVVGFSSEFDCDEFNKRIKSVTGHDVDCHFKTHKIKVDKQFLNIGLLYIPKRKDRTPPAQFKKNSDISDHGKYAFRKNDIYFRDGSECRPAKNSDDFSFLCAQGCRRISFNEFNYECKIIDNNLGAKDPGFIKFIGREEYLVKLWQWLFDRYMPIKLLTGLGGVGKTTLAREFVEDIIRSAPMDYDRVVWLSAKEQFYTAIKGEYIPTTRVDFYDINSLLISILKEIGWPEEQINIEWTREELMENLIESLSHLSVLLVIDDVDSLDLPEQHDVFQTISLIIGQTISKSKIASKALLTARLDLGAAPNQFITVKGLKYTEFIKYIEMASENIGLKVGFDKKSKLMKKFHTVTDGSPTFVASILRLLATGDRLNSVLNEWKGSVGEEVRNFAFKKELANLTGSQLRTLYAGCILGETSLVELKLITISNDTLLKDDISELKQYHLVSLGGELPSGGSRLIIPNSIRLMTNLIKEKIRDPKRIERECAKLRAGTPKLEDNIGMVVNRVIAHWKAAEYDEAIEFARWGNKKHKRNGDLKCLLGRAHMNLEPPNPRLADTMFRRAFELDCSRVELFELWINAKTLLKDWVGIIEVSNHAKDSLGKDIYYHIRIEAYGNAAEDAKKASNLPLAAEYYLNGAKEIDKLNNEKGYLARKNDILDLRALYFLSYIKMTDQMVSAPRDYLDVWVRVWELYKTGFISKEMITFGISRLSQWWDSVCEREYHSEKAKKLFEIQIDRVAKIARELTKKKVVDDKWVSELDQKIEEYENLLHKYEI